MTVHERVAAILAELPAIDKGGTNTQQQYKFRGIDEVMVELNPLLGKYKVFIAPHDIMERVTEIRTSGQGKPVYATYLVVRYRWYGPDGNYVEMVGVGEGTDSLDKATPKALTGAYKYMIFEALSISTREAAHIDADRGPSVETIHPDLAALLERFAELPADLRDTISEFTWEKVWGGSKFPMSELPESWWPHFDKWITKGESTVADRARSAQDGDAESTGEPVKTPAPQPTTAVPAAEPEPTPAATPETPAPEPTAEPTEPEADDTEAEEDLTWESVVKMKKTELIAALTELDADVKRIGKENVENIRNYYWLAVGGEHDTAPFSEGWLCPFCDTFAFDSQAGITAHMEEEHSGDEEEIDSAEDEGEIPPTKPEPATASTNGDEPAATAVPIDEPTLAVVRECLAGLKGASARAYAEYRRTKGLPAKPDSLTMDQAFELVDFVEKLPA